MKPKTVGRENGQRSAARRSVVQSGLIQGAIILTLDGELPVEYLQPGDRVVTRDVGMARIRNIVCRQIRIRPLILKPGTLGQSRPAEDIMMLPGQHVLLRDWRAKAFGAEDETLVTLSQLVDGAFIFQCKERMTLRVFDLQFDAPHILYADGVETASASCSHPVSSRARLPA